MNRAGIAAAIVTIAGFTFYLTDGITTLDEGFESFAAVFASEASTAPSVETRFAMDVRPPHLEWWLGWKMDSCAAGDQGRHALPVIECRYAVPEAWRCHEARIYRVDSKRPAIASGEWSHARSEPSNKQLYGVCPDPMPARVPLATPEPNPAVPILGGALALFGIHAARRRLRSEG